MENKKGKIIKIIIIFLIFDLIVGSIVGFYGYSMIFKPNVKIEKADFVYLYIPTGANYQQVLDSLYSKQIILNKSSFEWVAKQKNYDKKVKAGKYKINNNLSNNDLVNLLRSGNQQPVNVTFNNVRLKTDLAGKISTQLETDSLSVLNLLNDEQFVDSLGFTTTTILAMFIPNTYEFYWNTSAKKLILKMYEEYNKFWTEEKIAKANDIGLSKLQVSILASIVQAEQSEHADEQPIIAGLYINRLKRGIALQSDPTLVYACGDFTIKRVLNKHKEIDSPYNTYMYAGLPPSPINLPEMSALNAVLNYETTDYIFMCAKEDFSGYHNFSTTNAQHEIYARKYQNALDKMGIK